MNRRNFRRGSSTSFRREGPPGEGRTIGMRSLRTQELDQDREIARTRQAGGGLEWKKMDLHLHTPASSDYRDPGISYLDILKKAEEKGLDMIAFADHNTVAGYAAMHREIETLTLLERLGRMTDIERDTLSEYRRLLARIVVLPGFEFTATFGFHILGIFPENTSIRKLEYLLLNLNVPEEKMVMGAPDAGSTSDVLNAYQSITAAGGLAIAAHANSSNGVAMQGFPFGGQTKIAYTQDPNLAALEVTDMDVTGRRTTASFYNASKPEYPRRMHIIQGSDAHSLNTEQADSMNKRLGVGSRITEVLVKEASFAALKELLTSNDFTRTRPYRQGGTWEFVEKARLEGQTVNQSFHERAISRTTRTRPILHDIVAFSNGEGGTIFIGANSDTTVPIHGIEHPDEAIRMLQEDIRRTIEPPVDPDFSNKGSMERGVVVITVQKGADAPYAFTPTGQIYVRDAAESVVANRDEIVSLVLDASRKGMAQVSSQPQAAPSARAAQPAASIEAGEPLTPTTAMGKAVPVPTQPQLPQSQPRPSSSVRDARREQPTAPATEARQSLTQVSREQRSPVPSAPMPPPAAERRAVRPPVFSNLPPEKLKGQIRPMLPASSVQELPAESPVEAPLEMPVPVAAETVESAAPEVLPATLESELELVPVGTQAPQVPADETRSSRSSRSRNRRDRQPASAEATVAQPEAEAAGAQPVIDEALPQPVPETAPEAQAATKSGRSRSRGKTAAGKAARGPEGTSLIPATEAPVSEEVETPREVTVSSEHLTREEIVEAQPEQSGRGKGRSSRRREKQREIDAPTAAAAETEAAAQAILVEAELEPGAQIPAEVDAMAAEPEMTSPPAATAIKGRSRRKSAAQRAAEATVETPPEAPTTTTEEAPVPEAIEATQTKEEPARKGRGRSRKQESSKAADGQSSPTPRVPGNPQSAIDKSAIPTEGPNTGVEIISTEERNGQKFHTMRDMRDGTTVHNVTRKSARRLWYYAILQHEHGDPSYGEIAWHPGGAIGLWRREHRAGASRYDLVARYPDGSLRIFYGVTDDGLAGPWQELVQMATEAEYWGPPPMEK